MTRNKSRLEKFKQSNEIITSVEPKVMVTYDPIPGEVPRKVAIDRKKIVCLLFTRRPINIPQYRLQ